MLKVKQSVSMLILSIGGHPQDLINLQLEWKVCKLELKYCFLLPVRPSSCQKQMNDRSF